MQLVSPHPSAKSPTPKTRQASARFGKVAAALSLIGLVTVGYLGGAVVMYFGLPTSSFLAKAFAEGQLWASPSTTPAITPITDLSQAMNTVDDPKATFDGYTLYTSTHGPEATLLDLRGHVVHQWSEPAGRCGPHAPQSPSNTVAKSIHWERCHVYPNGDLLALYGETNSPYGAGLIKLDKDSRFLWAYSASAHHDFDVGEDGRIYLLTQQAMTKAPRGLGSIPSEYTADYLSVLSAEGKELETIPLLEAFRDSPYFLAFLANTDTDPESSFPNPPPPHLPERPGDVPQAGHHLEPPEFPHPHRLMLPGPGQAPKVGKFGRGDIFHTNSVKVLNPSLAPRFPLFKPGQVLLSLRSPNLIAVLDLPTHSIAWAARGAWQSQHDARFLDNGHLMMFDNSGSARASRVLEYDPVTQAIPWFYTGEGVNKISTQFRGTSQRLPNENTLIVDPDGLRVIEVTKNQRIVWQWGCAQATGLRDSSGETDALSITGAWRFGPEELPFLKAKPGIRPR